jgi:Zn-finger nucleic acid-binding protein
MCPDCDEPLVIYELEGVEVDHCLGCSGSWLDAGELELLGELSGIHAGALTAALAGAATSRRGARRCPRCRRRLDVVRVGDGEPVELDRCPVGHGFWLDRGETVAVIRAFGGAVDSGAAVAPEESAVARFFASLYEDELRTENQERAS